MRKFLKALPRLIGSLIAWLLLCIAALLLVISIVALCKVLWVVLA